MSPSNKTPPEPTGFPEGGAHDPGAALAGTRAGQVMDAAVQPIELADGGATVRLGTASWTDPTMVAGNVF